jgi:hypothetical protein
MKMYMKEVDFMYCNLIGVNNESMYLKGFKYFNFTIVCECINLFYRRFIRFDAFFCTIH